LDKIQGILKLFIMGIYLHLSIRLKMNEQR